MQIFKWDLSFRIFTKIQLLACWKLPIIPFILIIWRTVFNFMQSEVSALMTFIREALSVPNTISMILKRSICLGEMLSALFCEVLFRIFLPLQSKHNHVMNEVIVKDTIAIISEKMIIDYLKFKENCNVDLLFFECQI